MIRNSKKFIILSLFPEMFSVLDSSILGRAIKAGHISIDAVDIRPFSPDTKHFTCDDTPFGGGAGMVMTAPPIYNAIESVDPKREFRRVYLSPKGSVLSSKKAKELAVMDKDILLLCGRYEGIDQRAIDLCIDEEISIGDFVLTGGELASMVVVDAVSRFIPGVLGSELSTEEESFSSGLLEYPHYTRPQEFMGLKVPEILLSGNHGEIAKWREERAKEITKERRPDLLE